MNNNYQVKQTLLVIYMFKMKDSLEKSLNVGVMELGELLHIIS